MNLWRIFLVMAKVEPLKFYRPIESFLPQPISLVIHTDASLTGLGLVIRTPDQAHNDPTSLIMAAGIKTPYVFNSTEEYKSSYQNTMEFLALTIALFIIRRLGYINQSIRLWTDSTTVEDWSTKQLFKVGRSTYVAVAFVRLGIHTSNHISQAFHIPGEQNILCDALSRNKSPYSLGIPLDKVYSCENDDLLMELLYLCDPTDTRLDGARVREVWSLIDGTYTANPTTTEDVHDHSPSIPVSSIENRMS